MKVKKKTPWGFSVVVEVISVVVVVISVVVEVNLVVVVVFSVVDVVSSIHRLSPEIHSSQDSSIAGQFSKRTQTGTKALKVNHRHLRVVSQS